MSELVVDGNNVIGARPDGWWRDRSGAARRLLSRLQELARTGDEGVTLVLDGRPLRDVPEGMHDGVQVLYARRGGADAADDRIFEYVGTHLDPAGVTVVTSDRGLRSRVGELGARVVGARALLERLDASG
jgi:predicted RNA-binding protein with PIN domain